MTYYIILAFFSVTFSKDAYKIAGYVITMDDRLRTCRLYTTKMCGISRGYKFIICFMHLLPQICRLVSSNLRFFIRYHCQ